MLEYELVLIIRLNNIMYAYYCLVVCISCCIVGMYYESYTYYDQ